MLIFLFKTTLICPLLSLSGLIALCNLCLAFYIDLLLWVYTDGYTKQLKRKLVNATSVSEYAAVATELDRRMGTDYWKREIKSHSYDYHRLQLWQKSLATYLESRSYERLCDIILQAQKSNHGGAFSPDVYSYTFWNTKEMIINYHKLITESLESIIEGILSAEKPSIKQITFVHQLSNSWGKAALILEGNRRAMYYHFGVCKGLLHLRCVPQYIYARESNALLGAWLSLSADNASVLDDGPCGEEDILRAMLLLRKPRKWYGMSFRQRQQILQQLTSLFGDITLNEAHNLSGRQLNLICKRNDQYYVMNHKTTSDVSIASAVLACVCEDVLQPTGGGASYPRLLSGGGSPEKSAAPGCLWGIVIKEERWLPVILPPALRVGRPNDSLSGTAGREIIGVVYAVRQLFRDLLRQLLAILLFDTSTRLPISPPKPTLLYLRSSVVAGLLRGAYLPNVLGALRVIPAINDISDLLTPERTRIVIAPSVRLWCSRNHQIAIGLTTAFQNACVIRIRLDMEKSIQALFDAAAQLDSTA